jgi:hypothetical protein
VPCVIKLPLPSRLPPKVAAPLTVRLPAPFNVPKVCVNRETVEAPLALLAVATPFSVRLHG